MACYCSDGWVCEEHADEPWPHIDVTTGSRCPGPGVPCTNRLCPFGQAARRGEKPLVTWDVLFTRRDPE